MITTVVKQFRFEAAHRLIHHDGHCARPHGHSYLVEVAIRAEPNRSLAHAKGGMVVDFADVKKCWEEKLKPHLDHQDLNVTLEPFGVDPTTAENIAAFVMRRFQLAPDWGHLVVGARVWETTTGYAQVGTW